MKIKLHDGFGHAAEEVAAAATAHAHSHSSALMRHLSARAAETGAEAAILTALRGGDTAASEAAQADLADAACVHPVALTALTACCGGLDPHVALALAPWFADEASIEAEDGSGLAWQDGLAAIMPVDGEGLIVMSTGDIVAHTPIEALDPRGRTLGAVFAPAFGAPTWLAGRRVARCVGVDGATVIELAAEADAAA